MNNSRDIARSEPPKRRDLVCVLIVEDTVIVADEIARMVKMLGCEVKGPIGAIEPALEFVASLDDDEAKAPSPQRIDEHLPQRIDLALLDVNLNGKEIFPVAEALLERGVPIVFLTGYARESIPAKFRNLACLEKPFGLHELEQAMEQTLGHAIAR